MWELQLQSEIFKSNKNSFFGESQREGTDLNGGRLPSTAEKNEKSFCKNIDLVFCDERR